LALQQAEPGLQKIYHEHYTGKEKDFIELLELVGEKGWAKVLAAVEILGRLSPTHLSTEKIVSLCKRNDDNISPGNEDDTLTMSKGILKSYGRLLNGSVSKFDQGVQVL
jgi:hypothetical protein